MGWPQVRIIRYSSGTFRQISFSIMRDTEALFARGLNLDGQLGIDRRFEDLTATNVFTEVKTNPAP